MDASVRYCRRLWPRAALAGGDDDGASTSSPWQRQCRELITTVPLRYRPPGPCSFRLWPRTAALLAAAMALLPGAVSVSQRTRS